MESDGWGEGGKNAGLVEGLDGLWVDGRVGGMMGSRDGVLLLGWEDWWIGGREGRMELRSWGVHPQLHCHKRSKASLITAAECRTVCCEQSEQPGGS